MSFGAISVSIHLVGVVAVCGLLLGLFGVVFVLGRLNARKTKDE